MATKTPEWDRPGYVEQGQHNKQNKEKKKKTNRRPLNTICHLIGGKALKLVSLPANSGPLGSRVRLQSDRWSHKANIQSDLNTLFTYIRYVLE